EFADALLQAKSLPEHLFAEAAFFVTGTLALASPDSRAAVVRSLEFAERHGVKVAIDLNWRPGFWPHPETAPNLISSVLQQADYLKCTEEEACWYFHTDRPAEIASRVPRARGIAVTSGDRGCTYLLNGQSGHIPAFAVRAIDTTGAGDSFLAGWLVAMTAMGGEGAAESPEVAERVFRFASAAGALATTKAGAIAAQPTTRDIHALLARDRG
ncbi:MAG: PfkB family carbohydrate kinase, partial [Cyanobacteria bacterium J06648_11]